MAPLVIGQLTCSNCHRTGIVSHRQDDQKAPEVILVSDSFVRLNETAAEGSLLFKCLNCGVTAVEAPYQGAR